MKNLKEVKRLREKFIKEHPHVDPSRFEFDVIANSNGEDLFQK